MGRDGRDKGQRRPEYGTTINAVAGSTAEKEGAVKRAVAAPQETEPTASAGVGGGQDTAATSEKPAAPKPAVKDAPVVLSLVRIPDVYFKSSYSKDESVPKRMLWVNEEVEGVLNLIDKEGLRGLLWVTDIYRSPMESYTARLQKGPIVAPAGLSGHNYGISADFDVDKTKKALGIQTNEQLRAKLAPCAILPITTEFWHFNFVFNPERDYFLGLYRRLPAAMREMPVAKFVSRFSELIGTPLASAKDVQRFLSLKDDGVVGPMTFMSATMLIAARNGMLPIQDKQREMIKLNFNNVW